MRISSRDLHKRLNFQINYTLYDSFPAITAELFCTNASAQSINIRSLEPVCATEHTEGFLKWTDTSKVITNGPMYYDSGMIHSLSEPYSEPSPYGPIKGGKLNPDFTYPSPYKVRSWWNTGFFKGYDREGLVCGFIENKSGLGQIITSRNEDGNISLYTESVFAPGTLLEPSKSISSNRFIFILAGNPYSALEKYADVMGKLNNKRILSPVDGWCNWFFTYEHITEDEVVRNAEFASRNLRGYGLKYIQIDEGYQKYHGDWEGNEKFPHGMKWLAEKIRSYGLKPGLWIAPYVISEPAEVFQKHPEWLLKNEDGSLRRVGPWPDLNTDWAKNENPKRYGLDITHPGAAEWFYNLFHKASRDWGYEMFKIDFVAWSVLSAYQYYDKSFTPAAAYRKGAQLIRDAAGSEAHINECGPGNVSSGLIDSMRIEIDQNYGYSEAAWRQYFSDSASSAASMAKRYYFNKRTWINDADHVCIGLLSLSQARAAATLIALSGGNIISGDRLTDLDISRLEILKKIYPSYGQAAKPTDLFDSDRHTVFALKVRKTFGEWTVAGLFNPDANESIHKTIPLERLGLIKGEKYVLFDFWMEKFIGEISEKIETLIMPGSVNLFSIHRKRDYPHVISTDRHVLQGAVELENVLWDENSRILKGISAGPRNSAHNVFIYLPSAQAWVQGGNTLHQDFENYTLKLVSEQILSLHLRFNTAEKIHWQVDFNSFPD